jgi:hypothetical protein
MHSTKEFSNYKSRCSTKLLKQEFIQRFDFDFTNIDIEIELIKREKLKRYQTREFKNFWKSFFEENNAQSVKIH